VSYSWDEFVVPFESSNGFVWLARVFGPFPQYETARQEYHRLKANEILHPDRYRKIRLMKQTSTVSAYEDVSP
jgi:hypothetical protein